MLGSKVSNLLLAEKNIIDFVDKNLGQEKERLLGNELELDPVCHLLVGGVLGYPAMISHDFCDITTALDIYIEAFTKSTTARLPPRFGTGIFPPQFVKNERLSKMPFRGDELSERQFLNAVVQSSVKIRAHIIDCMEACTESGRLENLYVIISNVVMIRNYIWMFQQVFHFEAKSNTKLIGEYNELSELVEVISERMLLNQMNLLTTYVIQDEVSQNWSSTQSYYEGQRGSPTIQMWSYFLKRMQRDMWMIMPPQLAQRILGILLNDSLGILVARYSKIEPSDETMSQFCSDVINILGTVEELLYNVSTSLDEYCGDVDPSVAKTIFSIHTKCRCLVTSLVLVGTPIEVLYKTFRRGLSSCILLEKSTSELTVTKPMWMTVLSTLCPKYYPSIGREDWELFSNLRLLCAQPGINWMLVYNVISMNNSQLGSIILQLFPEVVAPPTEFLLEGKGFKKCLNAGCIGPKCHSLPKSVANHHVSSCVLYLLAHTIPKEKLAKIYHALISHVSDWYIMDKTQVWTTTNRPVWFQSLIDLLLPILKTCVQGLCLSLINGNVAVGIETTQFVIEILNSVTEIVSIIPRGFFLICEEIDDFVPSSVYPVRNNVPVHFLVTALYQLLNLGPGILSSVENIVNSSLDQSNSNVLDEEKDVQNILPLLLSISERLCHLDDGIFDQTIHRLISQIESMMKQTQAELKKKREDGFCSEFVAQLKVNFLLEESEGQLALRIVYWFINTHGDVLQNVIRSGGNSKSDLFSGENQKDSESGIFKDVAARKSKGHTHPHSSKVAPCSSKTISQHFKPSNQLPNSLRISPRTRTYYKSPNIIHNFHYVNKCRTFDEIVWNFNEIIDWVATIRNCKMGLHKSLIMRQLERRPEFQSRKESIIPQAADTSTIDSSSRQFLLEKSVDEIKSLLSQIVN